MADKNAMAAKVKNECHSHSADIFSVYGSLLLFFFTGALLTFNNQGVLTIVAFALIGVVLWNFVEYGVHRYTFHTNLPKAFFNHLTFGLHMYHHGQPEDKPYIPVPLRFSISIFVLIFLGLILATQNLFATFTILSAFAVSYLSFEWIHGRIHNQKPANKFEQAIHQYHLYHHWQSDKKNYGVTFPFVDMLLGTAQLDCWRKVLNKNRDNLPG